MDEFCSIIKENTGEIKNFKEEEMKALAVGQL